MRHSKWAWTAIGLGALAILFPANSRAEGPVRQGLTGFFSSVVEDAAGVRPRAASDPSTLLYTSALHTPLLAPDGHQLTWGEWRRPVTINTSLVSAKCVQKGTHVVVEATGLVPNALYSVWLFTQVTVGAPVSMGAVPSLVGDNAFRTDETGAGSFNAIIPAGPLSLAGEAPACLFDNPVFVFQLAYHSDGQLYGGEPGPLGITLDHINFRFLQ